MNHNFFEPEPPKLEAIIYAEFDNEIGRVIKYQVPHEIFDKQSFDTISSAIIPSEEMRDRMIKINIFDYKIMGHPIGIKDKKYAREVYIFNMCFIVSKTVLETDVIDTDIIYEPLVQKCSEYLIELEKERCFLSEEKERLPDLMRQIFYDLNSKGECIYKVTEQSTIYLKLCPSFHGKEPPSVNPFLVPIFTRIPPPTSFEQLNKMDVLSQKICPQIDGVRCIKDIANAVQIDSDLVGRCIRNLYFYGCITLLPLFLYSNTYVATEKIRHFLETPKIIEECLKFVVRKPDENSSLCGTDVYRLYLSLKRGISLKDWCLRMRPQELNIDERKLIQFGMFYGFVRKLLLFPVAITNTYSMGQNPLMDINTTKIASICNGENSLEDLALRYSCSPIQLYKHLKSHENFIFITR